ncbi:MAG: hypothetical protein UE295_12710 [Acutalibacteraceae bacterium]|nr:hypothetical protein [Acutalibacteraceae bacterium]
MMLCFNEADLVSQIILLVISQFAVISLVGGSVLLFKYKCRLSKLISVCFMLLLNIALYVLMQIDNRITNTQQSLHLHIPYIILLFIILLSLLFLVWAVLSETKNRRIINNNSIKEAFDNLPTGVCFFNETGIPVLCNLVMYRFSFAVCGKDVQFITDLESCLVDDFKPVEGVKKDGKVFLLKDGSAWRLEKRSFTYENGNIYIQFIATDVTDLNKNRIELQQENEQLHRVHSDLQRLSANVVAVTREEEILNAKMRVHDEMGRCLVFAQKYLKEDSTENIPDDIVESWQRAVSMLKYNNDTFDEDMLLQIRKTCEYMKLEFIKTGELPKEENVAYILTCAVRECVTNAVRYADSTKLYAGFTENDTEATVTVTNNGKPPENEIVKGGGLSNLQRRVERAGGVMVIQSLPSFKLTVTVPKLKEDIL